MKTTRTTANVYHLLAIEHWYIIYVVNVCVLLCLRVSVCTGRSAPPRWCSRAHRGNSNTKRRPYRSYYSVAPRAGGCWLLLVDGSVDGVCGGAVAVFTHRVLALLLVHSGGVVVVLVFSVVVLCAPTHVKPTPPLLVHVRVVDPYSCPEEFDFFYFLSERFSTERTHLYRCHGGARRRGRPRDRITRRNGTWWREWRCARGRERSRMSEWTRERERVQETPPHVVERTKNSIGGSISSCSLNGS